MLDVRNRGDLRDGADEVICPPRCRALVWICVNFRDHFQFFFFFPSPFYGGCFELQHHHTLLYYLSPSINFQFRFCAYQEAPCHLRPFAVAAW